VTALGIRARDGSMRSVPVVPLAAPHAEAGMPRR
jgi:hypothetical protein